jgi:hypothetical protein
MAIMARGHIRKRSEDSWTLVVELERDPATGKRRQKCTIRTQSPDCDSA